MLSRRTILLKPMQPAVSGYARLQTEDGRTLLQLHARGLEADQPVRLYWYLSGQSAQEIARAAANAHGEVSAEAEAPQTLSPERLQAVILIGGERAPRPLLIGLCAQQGADSLMDAKNAALALCERLSAPPRPAMQPVLAETETEPPAPAAEAELPREVFLPALDPAPYACAGEAAPQAQEQKVRRSSVPVEQLKPLLWPRGFESLRQYFAKTLPTALFDLPGWRFVYAAHAGGPHGLWIGICRQDGRVRGVAYVLRGNAPPEGAQGFRPMRGLDGAAYQVLFQNVS